jgi:hypothetical protein
MCCPRWTAEPTIRLEFPTCGQRRALSVRGRWFNGPGALPFQRRVFTFQRSAIWHSGQTILKVDSRPSTRAQWNRGFSPRVRCGVQNLAPVKGRGIFISAISAPLLIRPGSRSTERGTVTGHVVFSDGRLVIAPPPHPRKITVGRRPAGFTQRGFSFAAIKRRKWPRASKSAGLG